MVPFETRESWWRTLGLCKWLARNDAATDELRRTMEQEIMRAVDAHLGAIGRPGRVRFVPLLPKTRSGKVLRRSIAALAEGRDPGDLTTIEDPTALEQIRNALKG